MTAVIQNTDLTWRVEGDRGEVHATGLTNAEAWLFVDKLLGEQINDRESVAAWIVRQSDSDE